MTQILWTVWAEWDVGQEGIAFTSEDKARAWCHANHTLRELADAQACQVDDYIDRLGLVWFRALVVDPRPL